MAFETEHLQVRPAAASGQDTGLAITLTQNVAFAPTHIYSATARRSLD